MKLYLLFTTFLFLSTQVMATGHIHDPNEHIFHGIDNVECSMKSTARLSSETRSVDKETPVASEPKAHTSHSGHSHEGTK